MRLLLLLLLLTSVGCGPRCITMPSTWTYYDAAGIVIGVRQTTFVVCRSSVH